MWWRFLTFCLLVSFILIVVLNYLHDRPVVKLFFKRCCDDGIENDQVVFESFSNNYLKERLIAVDIVFDNGTFVPKDVNIEDVMEDLREKLNVHDPNARKKFEKFGKVFKGEEDSREELFADREDMLEVDTVNILEISEIKTNASELSVHNETKDDVVAINADKPDINTIIVTQ